MRQIFLEELLLVAADFSLRVLKNRRLKPEAANPRVPPNISNQLN